MGFAVRQITVFAIVHHRNGSIDRPKEKIIRSKLRLEKRNTTLADHSTSVGQTATLSGDEHGNV